jgi:hypothetical protein
VIYRDGGCPAVTKVVSSPSLRIQRVNIAGAEMICDVSSGAVRPVVPATFQRTVFAAVHGLAPPGIKATRRMISRRFVWHRCAADVSRWCRDCQECQHDKVTKQLATATLAIPVPEKRFSHLHVDLSGGAASQVSRWVQVYVHHHRPLYKMVRAGSGQEYGGHDGSRRAGRRVDMQI